MAILEKRASGSVEVVHLVNRLDASNATEVRQGLKSLMDRGCHRLALNLDTKGIDDH